MRQVEGLVFPEIRLVRRIDAHLERSPLLRAENEFQLRMQGISRPGLEVNAPAPVCILVRPHVQLVRLELVCSLVRLLEDSVVEVHVETKERIRHVHLLDRLEHVGRIALVGVGHLHGRVDVLCQRCGADQQCGNRYMYLSHILYCYIKFVSFASLILTLSRMSSAVPSAGE